MFVSMQLSAMYSLLPKYWIMHMIISPLTAFCSIVETCCDIQSDFYNATYVKHAKHGQTNAPHLGPKQRCAFSTTISNCALFLKFWKRCLVQENRCCFEQTIYKFWMVDEKDGQKLPKIGSEMAKHVSRAQNIIGPVPNASSESTLWWRNAIFTNNSPLWKQIVKSIKNTIWDNSIGTGYFDFNYLATKPMCNHYSFMHQKSTRIKTNKWKFAKYYIYWRQKTLMFIYLSKWIITSFPAGHLQSFLHPTGRDQ